MTTENQSDGRGARVARAHERAARMYEDIADLNFRLGNPERAREFIRRARRHSSWTAIRAHAAGIEAGPDRSRAVARYLIEDGSGAIVGEFAERATAEATLRALATARSGPETELLLWALDADGKTVGLPGDIVDIT